VIHLLKYGTLFRSDQSLSVFSSVVEKYVEGPNSGGYIHAHVSFSQQKPERQDRKRVPFPKRILGGREGWGEVSTQQPGEREMTPYSGDGCPSDVQKKDDDGWNIF